MFLTLSTIFKFDCFADKCVKESGFCNVFSLVTQTKYNEVTLKTKYEALKELDKNRSIKEVTIQFDVPGSTLAT